ncbi:hypothetical protein ABH892_004193 [Paenibacillus sp. RC254]
MKGVLTALRHKGKRQKPAETRGKFAVGRPISQRPKEVRSRQTFGHWELDTVVLGRGKSKGCVATFVERKTRLYTASQMSDRTAYLWRMPLALPLPSTLSAPSRPQPPTEARSLPVIPVWKLRMECRSTLLTLTRPGSASPTRTPMGSCANFSPKGPISPK